MRTAVFALALVLTLVLALAAPGWATPLNGEAKYGGPRDTGQTPGNDSGTPHYGGPRDNRSIHHPVPNYDATSYDSNYVPGSGPRKVGRHIGPAPRNAQGLQEDEAARPAPATPAPKGPRSIRYIGPEPRAQ